ncbi:uncharacterized protein LOC101240296 isoform X6 [Hydra vulgaris]|uniref:Uncharacterized protein LOC101240296 isoform X6 n=1 Tax=Hydra vulgaris TaxID=6087 RepID=A0ABM4C4K7_HYDVU
MTKVTFIRVVHFFSSCNPTNNKCCVNKFQNTNNYIIIVIKNQIYLTFSYSSWLKQENQQLSELFTNALLLFCVQVIAVDYTLLKDTILKRQKRVLDDDYINLNAQKPIELAKDNIPLSKLTTNDEVFQALLQTPKVSPDDIKEQRLDKRYADKEKDSFEKLKDFFDNVEKRSVDDYDSGLQNEFTDDKLDGERPFKLKSTLEAISIDEAESASGSGFENVTYESGDAWVSGSGADPLVKVHHFSSNNKKVPTSKDQTDDYTPIRISKREIQERFEGLPESLAVNDVRLARENPRVKILKNEAGNKVFDDIPLPFNKISEETNDNTEANYEENNSLTKSFKENRGTIDTDTKLKTTRSFKPMHYKEFKTLDILKHELGDDTFKNLRIIDEQKAKSLFDDDEGQFLNSVKKDGIYYDSRSKKILISAQIKSEKPFQNENSSILQKDKILTLKENTSSSMHPALKENSTVATIPLIILNTSNISIKENNISSIIKLPLVNESSINCTLFTNNSCYISDGVLNKKLNSSTSILPDKSDTVLTKKDIEEIFSSLVAKNPTPLSALKSTKLVRVQKREILSDLDPNIAKEMGDTGKQLEDEFKVNNKRDIDKNEKVLFPNSLLGIWSGLGTEPEFVHGLIKQDFFTEHGESELENDAKDGPVKYKLKNLKLRRKKKLNQNNRKVHKGKSKTKFQSENNVAKSKNFQKRDFIPFEEEEQEESKHMEMGSLGSLNMHVREKRGMSTNLKDDEEDINLSKNQRQLNEESFRLLNDSINHATKPSVHGKVVFAFDEVKELMPTRRFFSKQDPNLSPELLNIENSITQSRSDISYPSEQDKFHKFQNTSPSLVFESLPTSTYLPPQKTFDLDKDLADSMVLEEKQHFLAAMPVKVEFSSNKNPPLTQERSNVYKEPKIFNESMKSKLHKVQLAQLKANELRNKYQQLINWESSNPAEVPELEKDGIETEKELKEFGKQFENTDIGKLQEAEIRALSSPSAYHNAETSDIAYLAKKLQEKHFDAESPEHKARTFNQLQQKILNEQEQYKLLLQQQQKEYQDKLDSMAYYDTVYSNKPYEVSPEPYEVSPEVQPADIQEVSMMTEDLSHLSKYPFNHLVAKKPDTKPNKQFSKDSPYILSFKNAPLNNTSLLNRSNNLSPEGSQTLKLVKNVQETPDLVKPIENKNQKTIEKELVQKEDLNQTFNSFDLQKKSANLERINVNNSGNISHDFLISKSIPQQSISADLDKNSTFSWVSNTSVPQLNKTEQNTLPNKVVVISGQLVTNTFTTTSLPVVTVARINSSILKSLSDEKLINVSYFGNATAVLKNFTASYKFDNISTINETSSKLSLLSSNNTNLTSSSLKDTKSLPVPLPFPIDISYQPKRSYKALEIEQRIDGYIGCYIDHLEQGRDLPVRAGVPFVTPNNCRSACKKTGYRYAGLQYGYLCFCGNSYGKYDIAPDTDCDTVCSGNETHTCGGLWRNKIYSTENVDEELNEGPIPVYITPREKYHLRVQPDLRSNIPEKPFKSQVLSSNDFNNGISQPIISTEEILKATQDAEKKDIANLQNLSVSMNKKPIEHEGETLINFSYLHPQKETEEEFQNSPPMPLKIEPGTHLFRGEVILKQSWYSDLANPNSTKYLILTGNIEQALKNLFAKDPMFLKAEVMSLREISHRMPRKTLVDFTLTFEEHKKSQDVARVLFTLVRKTERLDAMPVLPATLKIKEYLFEPSVQAYIPQVIEGNFTEDFSKEIQSNEIDKNLNSFETTYVSPVVTLSEPILSQLSNTKLAHTDVFNEEITRLSNHSFNEQIPNHLKFSNLKNFQTFNTIYSQKPENIVSVNRAVSTRIMPVKTRIIPVKTSGVNELNKYLESQSKSVIASPKMVVKSSPSNKKVPYVLRMFFWRDMLARKKREDLDDHREKVKKTIKFSSALPVRERRSENDKIKLFDDQNLNTPINAPVKPKIKVIREARSQADQWSTKYKRDVDKSKRDINKIRAHHENSLLLKRTKRVVPRKELQLMQNDKLEDKDDFSTLFQDKQAIRTRRHVVKKELISDDNPLKTTYDNFSNELEKELHRNKRFKDER